MITISFSVVNTIPLTLVRVWQVLMGGHLHARDLWFLLLWKIEWNSSNGDRKVNSYLFLCNIQYWRVTLLKKQKKHVCYWLGICKLIYAEVVWRWPLIDTCKTLTCIKRSGLVLIRLDFGQHLLFSFNELGISNCQPKFVYQSLSYKRETELTILCYLNIAQGMFLFCLHFEFWKESSRFRTKMNFTNARSCLFMLKTNNQIEKNRLEKTFTGILKQGKQNKPYLHKVWALHLAYNSKTYTEILKYL